MPAAPRHPAPRTLTRLLVVLATLATAISTLAVPSLAHEERESVFPDQNAPVPVYRPFDEAIPHLVVCKPDSGERIAAIGDPELKAWNEHLLDECAYEHVQAAVDEVTTRGTNIYVLPGLYREEPSWDPPCAREYDGGVVSYDLTVSCGEVVNLITVAGDDPADEDIVCDTALCDLQIEGTGERPDDVLVRGGFNAEKDWIKHNGIKADRADGFYLRNMAFELFRENAIYVHETDGYVLDRVVARHNDLYGILTFTSDHGLMKDCEAHHNGDSGIYPGAAADVNADNDTTGPLERWAAEIDNCSSHHNALGYSGTAGNSVYIHDSEFFANAAGIVTDSFVPNHPGLPQDHLWVEGNRIYGNNENYYEEFVHSGVCDAPPADRGYETGTVCPVFPVPVGTGIMIAGGNHDLVNDNLIYDNWRQGAMQFWVPAAFRDEYDPTLQFDTSNGNHYRDNVMGETPDGFRQPNGVDFWWDDQGTGNCWQGNTSTGSEDGTATHNSTDPRGLPDCDSGGSTFVAGNVVKSAGLVPCSQYDREDNPAPDGCDWFDSPAEPEGRETAGGGGGDEEPAPAPVPAPDGGDGSGLPATGGPFGIALLGLGLVAGARRIHRARMVALP